MTRKFALSLALLVAGTALAAAPRPRDRWVGTWEASPAPIKDAAHYDHQTLREIVHVSLGGRKVRLRLSNVYGTDSLLIGAAHIAIRSTGASIDPLSDRPLTFSGQSSTTIPPGALALSDPVTLAVPAQADLAVSIYLPGPTAASTGHWGASQTSYVSKSGDFTGMAALSETALITSWPFVSGVDVSSSVGASVVAALGDSITDGAGSTHDTNHRWPDRLAQRLLSLSRPWGVLNAGIGGNRILHEAGSDPRVGSSALARLDRDVLVQPGVTDLIVLEGINDIGMPGTLELAAQTVTAEELIAGLQQIVERAHERGVRVLGGTIVPFEGCGYYTTANEAKRQALNQWIRSGRVFDGVVDFDQALRDPAHPTRLLAAYDCGDHLHPNDAGYTAMGDAVDLTWFR